MTAPMPNPTIARRKRMFAVGHIGPAFSPRPSAYTRRLARATEAVRAQLAAALDPAAALVAAVVRGGR